MDLDRNELFLEKSIFPYHTLCNFVKTAHSVCRIFGRFDRIQTFKVSSSESTIENMCTEKSAVFWPTVLLFSADASAAACVGYSSMVKKFQTAECPKNRIKLQIPRDVFMETALRVQGRTLTSNQCGDGSRMQLLPFDSMAYRAYHTIKGQAARTRREPPRTASRARERGRKEIRESQRA